VKTNIGHLEAAAGIAGFIKVMLSLRRARLPAHLHFRTLNSNIPKANDRIKICARAAPWECVENRRVAGVSSFGFGGTNCHVIVEQAPAPPAATPQHDRTWHVLALAAPHKASLQSLAARYAAHVDAHPDIDVADFCYTANTAEVAGEWRLAVCADNAPTLAQRLHAFAGGAKSAPLAYGAHHPARAPEIAFLFTGQGAQFPGMGRELYRLCPDFRAALDQCGEILHAAAGVSLTALLYGDDPALTAKIHETEYAQPSLFAFEYALAQLWRSWGVQPSLVLGHSLGEYTAACVAGVMSVADAINLLVERARLMQSVRTDGVMVQVRATEADVRAALRDCAADVAVAAVNAPALVVLAGTAAALEPVLGALKQRGARTQPLAVARAFHSAHMDPVLDEFERVAGRFAYRHPTIPLVSNLTGQCLTATDRIDARYWRDHLRHTVRFAQGVQTAIKRDCKIFLELGPDAVLSGMAKHSVDVGAALFLPSARRSGPAEEILLSAVAQLYVAGATLDWDAFDRPYARRRVALPAPVYRKKRYWPAAAGMRGANGEHDPSTSDPTPTLSETGMEALTTTAAGSDSRTTTDLRRLVAGLLHMDVADVDTRAPFLEMGADSLILLEAIHAVEDRFGVRLTINQLFEDTPTIEALAAYLQRHGAVRPPAIAAERRIEDAVPPDGGMPAESAGAAEAVLTSALPGSVEDVLQQQLRVMSQQLDVLGRRRPMPKTDSVAPAATAGIAAVATTAAGVERVVHDRRAPATAWGRVSEHGKPSQPFTSWYRAPVVAPEALDLNKKAQIDVVAARYLPRTSGSKLLAQRYRPVLADNRASAGFRLSTKEMLYPIVGKRARGARMWDIDGSEYIDFTMGFGANLFGHSPAFITQAIQRQLDEGFQIGPQSELAGPVAEKIAALTRQERVAFCNSGSEAVMTAVRLARAVTGRTKLAIFSNSYHGIFDGVLARAQVVEGLLYTVPVAPGVPRSFVADEVLVLEYGHEESLKILADTIDELAAVIVEPVQSRAPENQPVEFLRQVRTLTHAAGVAFIWDEVITGFRAAPGGAQEYFGISADIATYGKVLGGGMPIGVVAGKARFLDAIDGGMWSYGDNSYPRTEQTFFAGTFSKHPLAMSAALAVLQRLEECGPALQRGLNERTAALAKELNDHFMEHGFPLTITHFSSLFRFAFAGNLDLLFYRLNSKGIYIWEGRSCFLSTEHTDEDLARFSAAVKQSVQELRDAGMVATMENRRNTPRAPDAGAPLPLTPAQERFAARARLGAPESSACHIAFALELHGAIDIAALQAAFDRVLDRHDALRAAFDAPIRTQWFAACARVMVDVVDLSAGAEPSARARLAQWQAQEVERPFDVSRPPLLRATLVRLSGDTHVLHLTIHHLICDGMSLALVLDELGQFYTAQRNGQPPRIEPPLPFAEHLRHIAVETGNETSAAYWHKQLTPLRHVPQSDAAGARQRLALDKHVFERIKHYARTHKCTPFMVLFAAYAALLFERSEDTDVVVGIPVSGRDSRAQARAVGNFVNLLPVRVRPQDRMPFAEFVLDAKRELLAAYRHAAHPPRVAPSLLYTTFNMEPAVLPQTFADLRIDLCATPVTHVEFDLMMNVTETAAALYLDLDYRLHVFDADAAQRWLERYRDILVDILDRENWRLSARAHGHAPVDAGAHAGGVSLERG